MAGYREIPAYDARDGAIEAGPRAASRAIDLRPNRGPRTLEGGRRAASELLAATIRNSRFFPYRFDPAEPFIFDCALSQGIGASTR